MSSGCLRRNTERSLKPQNASVFREAPCTRRSKSGQETRLPESDHKYRSHSISQTCCLNCTTPPNAARADATTRQRLRSQESPLLQSNKTFGCQTNSILYVSMCFGRLTDAMFDLYMSIGGPLVVLLSCNKWFVRPTNALSCGCDRFGVFGRRCIVGYRHKTVGAIGFGRRPRPLPGEQQEGARSHGKV